MKHKNTIKILIKIRYMRVDFYAAELRNLGQADGAHKVGASARSSQKPTKTVCFLSKAKRYLLNIKEPPAAEAVAGVCNYIRCKLMRCE